MMEEDFSPDCFVSATADIGVDHKPVRVMIRCEMEDDDDPAGFGLSDGQISGWILMSGEENPEELKKDEKSVQFFFLRDIVDHDPAIIPYLTTPAPCRLERDESVPVFFETEDD